MVRSFEYIILIISQVFFQSCKLILPYFAVDEAKLEYVKEKQNSDVVLNMWHTEVPPKLQGKGIAKLLAKVFYWIVNYCDKNN